MTQSQCIAGSVLSIIRNDAIWVSYDLVFKHLQFVQDQVYKLTKACVTKTYQLTSCNINNPKAWFLLPSKCTVVVYNAWKFHEDRCISFRVRAILLMQKCIFFSFWCCTCKIGNISSLIIFLSWPKTFYYTASIKLYINIYKQQKLQENYINILDFMKKIKDWLCHYPIWQFL